MCIHRKAATHLGSILFVFAALSASRLLNTASAAQPKPLEIGQPAPDFELPGVDGKTHRLADYSAAKVLVVVFTCNHCPTAQAYEDRIIQLDKDFKNRGVTLLAINPNDPNALRLDELGWTDVSDSLDDMKIRAKDRDFQFPYLYDGDTQKVATAYGVLATPHVFIFDADRKLRYQGRIDNSDIHQITSQDARNAIEALLAGQPVPVETTRVFGCSTKWTDKRSTVAASLKKWDAEPVTLDTIDLAGIKHLVQNDPQPVHRASKAQSPTNSDSAVPNNGPSTTADKQRDSNLDKLLLVNLWATWCGDCVAELPDLVSMNRMYRQRPFEFVTISLDEPDAKDQALKTLQAAHVSAKNYLFTGEDKDKLAEALDPKWQGPTPYTLLIAPGGKVLYRHEGAVDQLELKRAIVDYLGRTPAGK